MDHSHSAHHILSHWSWILPLSVLGSSLIGSTHCALMCGPLVMTLAPDRPRQVLYQGGRLLAYAGLGAVAGAFGEKALFNFQTESLNRSVAILFALFLVILGIQSLRGHSLKTPRLLSQVGEKVWRVSKKFGDKPQAFLGGLLTPLLPCGHLYAFFAGAAMTGKTYYGAIFMFAFWLGTLPALAWGSVWVRRKVGFLAQRSPRVTGLFFVGLGLLTLIMKLK